MISPLYAVVLLVLAIYFFRKGFKERTVDRKKSMKKRLNSNMPSMHKDDFERKRENNLFARLEYRAYKVGLNKLSSGQIQKESLFAGSVISLLVSLATENFIAGMITVPLGVLLPLSKIWSRERNKKFIELQIQSAANKMLATMKTSNSILLALQAAGRVEDPVGREFRSIVYKVEKGLELKVALTEFVNNLDSDDARILCKGLLVANEKGTSVAQKVIQITASVIAERESMRNTIAAATAMSNYTLKFVTYAPTMFFLALFVFKPDLAAFYLTNVVGMITLGVVIFLNVIGYIICRKILDIKRLIS